MGMPRNIDARKFYRVAMRRLEEAILIHEKLQLSAAAQYLGGYAVECILKALVVVATPGTERPRSGSKTIAWLKRDFGHDLDGLRRYLARRGHQFPRELVSPFVLVSSWDPQLRYEPGPGDPEETDRFLTAVEQLVKWSAERM